MGKMRGFNRAGPGGLLVSEQGHFLVSENARVLGNITGVVRYVNIDRYYT